MLAAYCCLTELWTPVSLLFLSLPPSLFPSLAMTLPPASHHIQCYLPLDCRMPGGPNKKCFFKKTLTWNAGRLFRFQKWFKTCRIFKRIKTTVPPSLIVFDLWEDDLMFSPALYISDCCTLPKVLSMNSSPPMNTGSHPPPSPHVSDVCAFGSQSGLPACSHMLFYLLFASGSEGQPSSLAPPPASLSLFGWPSLFPSPPFPSVSYSLAVHLLSLSLSLLGGFFGLFVCLVGKGGLCLFFFSPSSLILPSAFRKLDEKKCHQGRLEQNGKLIEFTIYWN